MTAQAVSSDAQAWLATLWQLGQQARAARDARELGFLLVNDTRQLLPYRQAVLWRARGGVQTLSGVVQIEANAPYVHWLQALCRLLRAQTPQGVRAFTSLDLPQDLADSWGDWWPAHALWVGQPGQDGGGTLWVRDEPWTEPEQALMQQWLALWWHAQAALQRPRWRTGNGQRRDRPRSRWWHALWALPLLGASMWPVQLTVLAPAELVPANPVIIRAPMDGVIDVFHVYPNQNVVGGQALFGFDEVVIQSRLQVAEQALATAQTEFRQASQQALADPKAKAQLAALQGKINERRAEADYLRQQTRRARVLAPQAGMVLMDDPAEWIGRPVTIGERILRIAPEGDQEVEAWVPMGDAIALPEGAEITLYLNASPLQPVAARLRYYAHDAVQRPDGQYAYRVRASLVAAPEHRVGLKGTARLHGPQVPLAYWMLRRPIGYVRANLGW